MIPTILLEIPKEYFAVSFSGAFPLSLDKVKKADAVQF
jgi:hypothetical protein